MKRVGTNLRFSLDAEVHLLYPKADYATLAAMQHTVYKKGGDKKTERLPSKVMMKATNKCPVCGKPATKALNTKMCLEHLNDRLVAYGQQPIK